jgi:hypothetical protein
VSRTPVVKDQRAAVLGGVAALSLGAFLLYDAYDARGRSRPFWMRFLPA